MTKQHTISSRDLRNLLFWAMSGYADSNGGSGERTITKIIAKYVQETKMTTGQFPPMGVQSHAELSGDTKRRLLEEMKKQMPKRKFNVI